MATSGKAYITSTKKAANTRNLPKRKRKPKKKLNSKNNKLEESQIRDSFIFYKITFNFNASAAGQVKLILMGRSANADWSNWQNPTYYDHALEETTSIKANDADVDVTGKGFLGSDAKTSVQVDLGNIAVKAGANTIVISALKQAPNMDCIALIADGITFSLPQA